MSRVTIPLNVDMYAAPVLCMAARAQTASRPTIQGALSERRLINCGTRFLSVTSFRMPIDSSMLPPRPWKIVNVKRMMPMMRDDAMTCWIRKGLDVLFAKAHMENAGEDWMPIRANI